MLLMMLGQRELSMIDATLVIGWKIKEPELAYDVHMKMPKKVMLLEVCLLV